MSSEIIDAVPVEPDPETPASSAVALRAPAISVATWTPTMVVSMEQAVDAITQRREFMAKVLSQVQDALFTLPGQTKPALGKPGAESLLSAFGLRSALEDEEPPELDFTGERHGGEPFFRYRRRCRVYWYPAPESRICVAQASGSCNSWETKYRYRNADRVCPSCGKAAIIKGNAQFGGGWLCWKKKDGCGAKFGDADPAIVGQEAGKVANPEPAELENTILKMADKRALVAATIIATNFSHLVTQDLEDKAPPADSTPTTPSTGARRGAPPRAAAQTAQSAPAPTSPPAAAPVVSADPDPAMSEPGSLLAETLAMVEVALHSPDAAKGAWAAMNKLGRPAGLGPSRWLPLQPAETIIKLNQAMRGLVGEPGPDPYDPTPIEFG